VTTNSAAYQAAYRVAHREELAAKEAAYRAAHREEINEYRRAYRARSPNDSRAYNRAYYQSHRAEIRAQQKKYYDTNWMFEREYQYARIQKRRDFVNSLKLEMGCVDCGYHQNPVVLEFDHRPGTVKMFDIGHGVGLSADRLLDEMAKCDVRCANCHRIKTHERREAKKAKEKDARNSD
jgi:hypothetical protein